MSHPTTQADQKTQQKRPGREPLHFKEIHPNAPRRLVRAYRKEKRNQHALALRLGVNDLYVSQLLRFGIEPTDKTEHGQEIRAKLFLPRRIRKPRIVKPEEWPGQRQIKQAIRKMVKSTKHALVDLK